MKEIKGFENYYITKEGEVISKKTGHVMCQWIDNLGYKQVVIRKNGKKKYIRVHRLVAEHFVDNPENKPFVNHIDGNKINNHFTNLEFCTNQQNTKHAYDRNLYKSTHRCEVELYDKNWNYIKTYPSIRKLADDLGLNRKTITSILKGEKKTNNYNYNFKYKQKGETTIKNIT